jgi:hypothetical protein
VRLQCLAHHSITRNGGCGADLIGDPGCRKVADRSLGGGCSPVAVGRGRRGRMLCQEEGQRTGREENHRQDHPSGHAMAPTPPGLQPRLRSAARSPRRFRRRRPGRCLWHCFLRRAGARLCPTDLRLLCSGLRAFPGGRYLLRAGCLLVFASSLVRPLLVWRMGRNLFVVGRSGRGLGRRVDVRLCSDFFCDRARASRGGSPKRLRCRCGLR